MRRKHFWRLWNITFFGINGLFLGSAVAQKSTWGIMNAVAMVLLLWFIVHDEYKEQ